MKKSTPATLPLIKSLDLPRRLVFHAWPHDITANSSPGTASDRWITPPSGGSSSRFLGLRFPGVSCSAVAINQKLIHTMKTLCAMLSVVLLTLTTVIVPQVTAQTSPSVAKDSRCFEMRTYYAAPGKFEAMNARFRDHTCKLFKKHGMELIGFWIPQDQDKGAENTMVYILAHKSREEAKKSWAAFSSDPDWKKARDESEVNGKLVDKVESVYLNATDYSPMK